MRYRILKHAALVIICALMSGCGGGETEPKASKPKLPDLPRPIAEDVRFPSENRKSIAVVTDQLLGLEYLGGGNIADYGKYKLLLIRCRNATQAGTYIFDIKNQMGNPTFVASYGGYYAANTAAGPLLVFAKGSYIGGIAGLSESEAVQTGKEFAARIPY